MVKYRKLKNPEWHRKYLNDPNVFYILSVDVARSSSNGSDNSVVTIFRVNRKNDRYYSSVVNIIMLGKTAKSKTFENQAIDIKRLIKQFQPKEVVIDTNGLGIGLGEAMTREQTDEFGRKYPAYGFFNDPEFKKTQPKNIPEILYGIKASAKLNSEIHANVYNRINSGQVRFLISEQEARQKILSTKVGQKMKFEERTKRLMPHEMTTKLFEECANLRLRRANGTDIALEQINARFPKDRYSSLAYGLWRIKELEDIIHKKRRKQETRNGRKLVFFNGDY